MTGTPGRPPGGGPARAASEESNAHHHHSTQGETSSQIVREAADVARTLPTDELAAIADALRAERDHWQALPDLDVNSRAVALILVSERLAAVDAELARRERLAHVGVCRSPARDTDYATWRALAEEVRRRVDCRDLLARDGWQPARQSRTEAAGPCPLCGGTDRFIVWTERVWCRRCGWSGDAVALVRALYRCGFREAIERLAEVAR